MKRPPALRPRVAFIYHFLPDYREAVFRELLDEPSIEAEFIAGTAGPGFEGVPAAENIPCRPVRNFWVGPLLWQSGVASIAWRSEHDVLVFRGSWLTLSTWVGAAIARLRGKAVFFWLIGWRRRESGVRRWLRPRYLRLAHTLLLYGERAKALGVEHGYPEARMKVIGNSLAHAPIDASLIEEPQGSLAVLWITRLLPYKKPELLIEALHLAHERGVELTCTFVGAGDSSELAARVDALGLSEHVRFAGRLSEERVQALLSEARVVAVPGHAGLTVAHALMNGIPVVVNDDADANPPEWEYAVPVNAPSDSAHEPNASYFRFDDAASLCDELLRWCVDSPASTSEKRRIARDAAEMVSPKRSAEAIVEAIHAFAPASAYATPMKNPPNHSR